MESNTRETLKDRLIHDLMKFVERVSSGDYECQKEVIILPQVVHELYLLLDDR